MAKPSHEREFGDSRPYPQIDWILATEFRHLPQGRWLPIVVEYDVNAAPSPEASLPWFADLSWLDPDLHRGVRVPPIFKNPPSVLDRKAFRFCTLFVDREFLGRIVRDLGWKRTILQAEVGPPLSDDAAREFGDPPTDATLKKGR